MPTAIGIECVDALYLVFIIAGAANCDPSPCNFVTAVENIISFENKRGLAAAASDERGLCNSQSNALLDANH